MRVLGIDTGYDAPCGLAIVDVRRVQLLWHGEVKWRRGDGDTKWERMDSVIAGLRRELKNRRGDYDMVAYELPYYSLTTRNAQTVIGLAHICGAIRALALEFGLSAVGVQPSEAKLALTINGAASKDDMIRAAKLIFNVRLTQHEADACGIALAAGGQVTYSVLQSG